MKKIFLLGLMTLSIFALSACGGSDIPEGKIGIEFWHMSPVGSESYSGTKAIINDFNASQDTYYVKGVGFSFWDYWDKVNVAIASDNAPEVGLHTLDNVILRGSNGALFNISDFIQDDIDAGLGEFDLSVFNQSQLDYAEYDGDLFALPFTATTRVLYYNLDMFAEVGLTEADVPTTWSELETVAAQLNKTDGSQIAQIGFDPTYGQGTYHGFLWQKGLDFFDENGDPTLNTQEHIDVLDWMVNFNSSFSRAQLNSFGEANQILGIDPFVAGRVAMMIGTDSLYDTMKQNGADINYGVTQIPLPDENGIRTNWGSGFSIELYDNNDNNPEKAKGSWEFLKFLMSKDIQKRFCDANGWIMANNDAMEELVAGDPIRTAIFNEVQYAVDKVYIPYAPNWHAADWKTYYDEALAGTMTAEQTLAAARALYLEKQENYNDVNNG